MAHSIITEVSRHRYDRFHELEWLSLKVYHRKNDLVS